MKTMKYILTHSLLVLLLVGWSSCEIDEIKNPNGPSIGSIEDGASLADLRLVVSGLESVLRVDLDFYNETMSIVAREYYDLNGVEPRYTGELLGQEGAQLDNNGFLTTRSFAARYRAVRNAWVLINAVENASATLTPEQKNGFIGYAKTLQAYALLLVANRQYNNGIRPADAVRDPDNLGPFLADAQASYQSIRALLDEANGLLTSAGDEFLFTLSPGFDGFHTPATFAQFNRALAARVSIYLGNKTGALTALNASFMDLDGDMQTGVYHVFSAGGNDIRNPLFYVPNSDLFTVHPTWLADAEPGDNRVAAKTRAFDPTEIDLPIALAGLTGDTQVALADADTDPFPIIRNEELILLYAEANVGSDNNAALGAIDAVRSAAGLDPYSGGTTDSELIDEILFQRRYSLFGEAHRLIDLRRYDRIDEIPLDRAGDVVHTQFPRPALEG